MTKEHGAKSRARSDFDDEVEDRTSWDTSCSSVAFFLVRRFFFSIPCVFWAEEAGVCDNRVVVQQESVMACQGIWIPQRTWRG